MPNTRRYAVYFAPPPADPLWRFGSAVLGYDAASGEQLEHPPLGGIAAADWPALTEEPRVYGFHATLKAPFRLAPGMVRADLIEALADLALRQPPVILEGLAVTALGSFVALTPIGAVDELGALALRVTSELDVVRAPLSEAELAKRLKTPLSERQRAQLERFGYPYVGEDFRFHMTLSGSLPEAARAPVKAAREEAYAQAVPVAPVDIDTLTLFEQSAPGERFRITERIPLG